MKAMFNAVPNYGDLFLEKILFSYEKIPMIFTCISNSRERFFCVCNDTILDHAWLITPISEKLFLDILYDKVVFCKAFEESTAKTIIAKQNLNEIEYKCENFSDIDAMELPDQDVFLDMQDELMDYILTIENEKVLII